jgi:NAD(P)-dependent dehydrogenase (short-subunit alcohol dehydrogenase family)
MTMAAHWTARDVPDQRDRLAIVTGANSGIGFNIARELAAHGGDVVLACRDLSRATDAAERIRAEIPAARLRVERLDLADLDSVQTFADQLDVRRVDLLVNNAGVMALPARHTTAQGFEMQFGTNHLGHFALSARLLPSLLAAPAARVVTVSSSAHRFGRIDFTDLQQERRYAPWRAYGQSKLANLLFVFELDRRARESGVELASMGAHPGFARTNLQWAGPREGGTTVKSRLLAGATYLFGQSDAMGALPVLYAATAAEATTGGYYGPTGPGGQRGYPGLASPTQAALDPQRGARLWAVSEDLTGIRFELPRPR